MKRILSVLLTLVLGLGPGLAAIPANALTFGWGAGLGESNLPACCRRNGVHHCMMNAAQLRGLRSGNEETSFSSSNCCPCFPRALATSVTPSHALAGKSASQMALIAERRTSQASEAAAQVSARRNWPKRGPPNSLLS